MILLILKIVLLGPTNYYIKTPIQFSKSITYRWIKIRFVFFILLKLSIVKIFRRNEKPLFETPSLFILLGFSNKVSYPENYILNNYFVIL